MTTQLPTLWFNLNGQMTCPTHAPNSLAVELDRTPQAPQITTTYDQWARLTPAMAADLHAMATATSHPHPTPTCETCTHNAAKDPTT